MFGKPEWFRRKSFGWGLTPVTWQGWGYAAGWALVIALPFIMLVERHQGIEAIIWMACGVVALVFDVREILKKIDRSAAGDTPEVMYLGPEDTARH